MLALVVAAVGTYVYVAYRSAPYIYTDIRAMPHKRAALVLGTSKYIAKGKTNYFYRYRIEAAAALWRAGKVDAIVVSGDNGTKRYNETAHMYRDLVKAGVPSRYIARDYAGFRTLDSVVRAGVDFGLEDYVIVSQRFHLERALFIARAKGQRAVGFVAKGKGVSIASAKMVMRELAARIKMLLDLYVLDTQPKYWGGKIDVRYRNRTL